MTYELDYQPGLDRPWAILRRGGGRLDIVFTFVESDDTYAREMLDRLNHPSLLDAPYEDDHASVFGA